MNPIAIIIPTIKEPLAEATARLAMLHIGQVEARIIISGGIKRGFTKTVNDGLRQAEPNEDVCILNDDIRTFYPEWLGLMQRALYTDRTFGIAGPSGKSSTSPMHEGLLGQTGIEIVDHVPFWCALIKRQVITDLGLLDERFIHYASDNYFCALANKRGWRCIWVRDVFIDHQHHGSGLITTWKEQDEITWQRIRARNRL